MIIHLPDPAAARVQAVQDDAAVITVQLGVRDAAHRDALLAVLEKAERQGYGLELRLISYEGQPDMIQQAKARKERKSQPKESECLPLS